MARRDRLAEAAFGQYALFAAAPAATAPLAGIDLDGLDDAGFLSAVLSLTMPARDARRVTARLQACGQVGAALAGELALDDVPPAAGRALAIVRSAVLRLTRSRLRERTVLLGSWDRVIEYCRANIGHSPIERLHVLFLDRKNCLIADEIQQSGTVDHVPLYPREVAGRALALRASAILVVHNHPSGDCAPSRADIEMTKTLTEALKVLGIVLHDHLIVSAEGHTSFRSQGLI